MPTLTTTNTVTTAVELSPRLQRKLLVELRAFQSLDEQIKALTEARDARKVAIGKLREESGETTLAVEGFRISLVSPVRSTLDKKLLLLNGVSMGQIELATKTVPVKPYEKISLPGDSE